MSKSYFDLMAALLWIRHILRHARADRLPTWLEGDGLAATKIDTVLALARACMDDEDSEILDFGSVFQ